MIIKVHSNILEKYCTGAECTWGFFPFIQNHITKAYLYCIFAVHTWEHDKISFYFCSSTCIFGLAVPDKYLDSKTFLSESYQNTAITNKIHLPISLFWAWIITRRLLTLTRCKGGKQKFERFWVLKRR